jgi:hypothetical protein
MQCDLSTIKITWTFPKILQWIVLTCRQIKGEVKKKSGQRLLLLIEYSEIKKERRSPMQERY